MHNSINPLKDQLVLENSLWMYNPDFWMISNDRYDFIKFNDQSEMEYLDWKGKIIRKDTLLIGEDGNYKLKGNPSFKGIEFIKPMELNLIIEVECTEEEKYMGIKELKFNLTKLPETQINLELEDLEKILTNSDWEFEQKGNEKIRHISFSEYQEVSQEEKKEILKESGGYAKYKKTNHLVKIENAVIAIQQKLDIVRLKAIISRISEEEIIMVNHYKEYVEVKLKRVGS